MKLLVQNSSAWSRIRSVIQTFPTIWLFGRYRFENPRFVVMQFDGFSDALERPAGSSTTVNPL